MTLGPPGAATNMCGVIAKELSVGVPAPPVPPAPLPDPPPPFPPVPAPAPCARTKCVIPSGEVTYTDPPSGLTATASAPLNDFAGSAMHPGTEASDMHPWKVSCPCGATLNHDNAVAETT